MTAQDGAKVPKDKGQPPKDKGPAPKTAKPAAAKPEAKPAVDQAARVVEFKATRQHGVPSARMERRHVLLLASFVLCVLLPALATYVYLWNNAVDRYASQAAFSVHREDSGGAVEMMVGLPGLNLGGGAAPDADILYQFIRSQTMVEAVDDAMDLRSLYGAVHGRDPLFALAPEASLEDMVEYWQRILSVVFEPDTGLITIEVNAYRAEDAQRIVQIVLDESSALIDRLSGIAQADTIRQAKNELDEAAGQLRETRLAMSQFRDVEQIIDPTADFAGQMGVITALQQGLAEAMVQRDLLIGTTTNAGDPRIQQADRKIEAIERRIAEERTKVGARSQGGESDPLSRVVGVYESLLVDREFAERAYLAARAAYDSAVAEARRRSRYLAVHIPPTLAQTAIYPERVVWALVVTLFLFMAWALVVLTAYSIRDRR
ncbi:MAG: hypothetical protein ACK5IB_11120 [Qingshengfaniella sp.]